MKRLFGADSVLFQIMTLLLELAQINVLFLCCCLPVITAGAGAAAMYEALVSMHQNGEGLFSARRFFASVRSHLKHMIPVWCVCLAAMAALVYGMLYWISAVPGVPGRIMAAVYLLLLVLVNGFLQFLCMFLALGAGWHKDLIKDSFLLAAAKYPVIILTALLNWSFLVLLLMPAGTILRILPLILLFWISSPGYVCTGMLMKVMRPLYPELFAKQEEQKETEYQETE
ncbi:MAG: DUF624 domain-containing protein [Lachnospiraceae bacterium]|nr:DUF624 domain-containing protein [Lachnospiraceae bacterium]